MTSLETAIEAMLVRGGIVEEFIRINNPELLDLFSTYHNEAIESRKFLDSSLSKLKPGDKILEIGGGIQALAIQLASEGFKITSVEPAGESFVTMLPILKLFSETEGKELNYQYIEKPIEECHFESKFDFIFSINVMEHLRDPYSVISQVLGNLSSNGSYHFFCPNYDFPYEPHFGKWLWVRKNKAFFLKPSNAFNPRLMGENQLALYKSINFITVKKVEKYCSSNEFVSFVENTALYRLMLRSLNDSRLRNRHLHLVKFVEALNWMGFLSLAKFIPKQFQPIMDITIKKKNPENHN